MNKKALFAIILFFGIFLINNVKADCGGAVACICGDNLTNSRTFDGSDNLINCSGTGLGIKTNDITLDCNGYNIGYGKTQTGFGINATGFSNITITNCNINQVTANSDSHGIYINSPDCTIINNNITTIGQWSDAIALIAGADNTLISGNILDGTASGFNGILLDIQSDSQIYTQ